MLTEAMAREALQQVLDPELGISIVDMGLVYHIDIEGSKVSVKLTLTSPGCPMQQSIVHGVRRALNKLPPVQEVDVEMVWEPKWTPEMMTAEGRSKVGMA